MFNLNNKKIFFLILLFSTLIFSIVTLLPLYKKAIDYVTLYRQAFVEPFPRFELDDGTLTFVDPVPVRIVIDDDVEILCDIEPDMEYFNNTKENSVLITESLVAWKTRNDFESFDVSEINIDGDGPVLVVPTKVSSVIDKYAKIVLGFAAVVLVITFFIGALLIVLTGGGVGFMIDAFQDGNTSFTTFVNISSFVFIIGQAFLFISKKMGIPMLHNFFYQLVAFLIIMSLVTLVLRQFYFSKYAIDDEMEHPK